MSDNVVELRTKKPGPPLSATDLLGLLWRESIQRRASSIGMPPECLLSTATTALALIQEGHKASHNIGAFTDAERHGTALRLQNQAYITQIAATVQVIVEVMNELVRLANLQEMK